MVSRGILLLLCSAALVSSDEPTTGLPTPPSLTTGPPLPIDQPDPEGFLGNCGTQRILKTAHGTFLEAQWPRFKVVHSYAVGPAKVSAYWNVEIRNEKVVLSPSGYPGRALHSRNGSIDLVDSTADGVEWTPFVNVDGSFSLQSEDGKWLSATSDWAVSTLDNRQSWEHFWLSSPKDCWPSNHAVENQAKLAEGHWYIVSALHAYIDNVNGKPEFVGATTEWLAHWLIEARGDKVVLRSTSGSFLQAHSAHSVEIGDEAHEWEPRKNEDGTWSFKSERGTWLSAGKNGTVGAAKTRFSMEKFWLEEW